MENNNLDIQKLVSNRISEIVESGEFQEQVNKKVDEMVDNVLSRVFTQYSGVANTIEEKIQDELKIRLDKLSLPEFSTVLWNAMEARLNTILNEKGIGLIQSKAEQFFMKIDKVDWKLSELMEKYNDIVNESIDDCDYCEGDVLIEVTVDTVEPWRGSSEEDWEIIIKHDNDELKVRVRGTDNRVCGVYSGWNSARVFEKDPSNKIKGIKSQQIFRDWIEEMVSKIFANKGTIEVDIDDEEYLFSRD